jgi:DNA-binding CsgD family transcriptional regulator
MMARVARLSAGQLECLRLVDQHLSSKEIAAQLNISSHTVDQRVRQALQTLGVERRAQAARIVAQYEGPYQRLTSTAAHRPRPQTTAIRSGGWQSDSAR